MVRYPQEILRRRTRQDLLRQRQQELRRKIEQPDPQQQATPQEREEYNRLKQQYDEQQSKLQAAISDVEREMETNIATFQRMQEEIRRKEAANPELTLNVAKRTAAEYANRADDLKIRLGILQGSQSLEEASIMQSYYTGSRREELGRQAEQRVLMKSPPTPILPQTREERRAEMVRQMGSPSAADFILGRISAQPVRDIKVPAGYSSQETSKLHSKYYNQLREQLSQREWRRLSEFEKNKLITGSSSYQAELQRIHYQPETTERMQEFAKGMGYAAPETYGVPYAPSRESTQYRPLGFVPSGAVISEAKVPENLIERAKYYLAMEQGRLDLLESRGQATMGTRAVASALTIPSTILGVASLGLKSPEEASKEIYREARGVVTPSTYAGIGGASHTDISRLGTSIFFTGALIKGGSLYSGTRVSSLAAIEQAPIRTIGVQVPTRTGMIQRSYSVLRTDKNLFFADTTGFGKVAGDYGVARGEGYVYAQKISGKPISQTGYDYFGTTQTGGKAYKLKDYGVIKTREPIGTGYIGKGGVSERYVLDIKQRGTKIKAKGEFYPLGRPYQPTPTQAGTIEKIGLFEAGDIKGSVLGVVSGEKVRMTKTSFSKFTRRVDPTKYVTKAKDKTILFKIETKTPKVEKTTIAGKKTPLSKTFQEQKAAETFGIQAQTTKEMLLGTAKKVITKQAEKKAAQVSLGTKGVSSLWWGTGMYERTEGGLMPPILRGEQISFLQDREKMMVGLRGEQLSLLGLGEREKEFFILGQPQPIKLVETQKEELLSALKLKQVQKQALVEPTIEIIPSLTPTTKKIRFIVPPPVRLSEKSKQKVMKALEKLKGKGVDVHVGMEKGKKKIVYKNLPPKLALKKAQEFVDNTTYASFRLVKSKSAKKPKRKDIKSVKISSKFRASKRKILYRVEMRKHRIDTFGEKLGLKTAKRVKQMRWLK